ncbi:MAG: RuBisCO large subunit C-terminal-like domain-containing protein [Candidatus Woesearchaeota archaeon]
MVFVDKKYEPDPRNDFVFEFRLKPKNMRLLEAAERIAEETSMRFWDAANEEFPKESVKLKPRVCDVDDNESKIWISYPREMFGHNNIADLISLYRRISSLGFLRKVKLLDLHVPERSSERFYGPRYGVDGLRKILKNKGPCLSVPLERSYSLTPSSQAKLAFELWMSGIDIVREDVCFSEVSTNPFFERVEKTMRMLLRAEKETGRKKIFVPNITSETSEMVTRADQVKSMEGNCVMLDLASAGPSALASLRKHSHVMIMSGFLFSAMEIYDDEDGISPLAAAKLTRLSGIDILDMGDIAISDAISGLGGMRYSIRPEEASSLSYALRSHKKGVKQVFPMVSGNNFPGTLPPIISRMGKDVIVDFDEACYSHPDGFSSGAVSIYQAREALDKKINLDAYSKRRKELAKSLAKWRD